MRNNTIDFDNLITRPGLHCLWLFAAEAEGTCLTARWIDSQRETREFTSASTVSALSTLTFSTFDASGDLFPEDSANCESTRSAWDLPLSQVRGQTQC
jgi:hypothetical protein